MNEVYKGFKISPYAIEVTEPKYQGTYSVKAWIYLPNGALPPVSYYCGVYKDKQNGIEECLKEVKKIIDSGNDNFDEIMTLLNKNRGENVNFPIKDK